MIEYKIRIDVKAPHTLDTKVELTSGDVQAYRLYFCFYDDGQPFDVSSCNLIVKGKRSDGTVIADRGIIEKDGMAYYDISGSMCAVAGVLSLEVALTNDEGTYLTTKELLLFVKEGHGDGELSEEEVTPLLTQMTTLINQTEVVKNECADVAKSCAAEEANRVQAEAERNAAVDIVMANAEAASRQAGEAVVAAEGAKNEAAAAALEAAYASLAAQKAQIAAEAMGYASLTVSTGVEKENTIDDSTRQPIISLRLLGESVQNGVPSPDAPIEVVSVGNPVVTFSNGTNEQRVTLDGITLRGLKDATGAWAARDEVVVDVKQGKVTLLKKVAEYTFTGAERISEYRYGTSMDTYTRHFTWVDYSVKINANTPLMCNAFKAGDSTMSHTDESFLTTKYNQGSYQLYAQVSKSLFTDTEDETVTGDTVYANEFKQMLIGNYIIYQLATPTETDITNTEAGQALLSLCTYYPETSVVCDADCTVTYIADSTRAFNKLMTRVAQLETATVNNM